MGYHSGRKNIEPRWPRAGLLLPAEAGAGAVVLSPLLRRVAVSVEIANLGGGDEGRDGPEAKETIDVFLECEWRGVPGRETDSEARCESTSPECSGSRMAPARGERAAPAMHGQSLPKRA